MPSNRYRSRKSLGSKINRVDSSTTRSEVTATPSSVGVSTVSSSALAKSAVIQDSLSAQSVDSTAFSTHAYQPSGAAVQRVPAPLTDIYYWGNVLEGLVELHASGVHGDEEIQDTRNVLSTKAGLVLSPTETEKARIYLTGRLPIPQSSKIYAQWNSNVANRPKLIYWVNTPEYLIESAKKVNGIAYFNIDSASPSINVGDTIRVTETPPEFDYLYKVIQVNGDTIKSIAYESAYEYKISDSSYNAATQVATFTISDVELLSNPFLNSNASDWSVSGGATVAFTSTEAFAGGGSLEITPSITQNAIPNVFSNVVVSANTTYSVEAYVKAKPGVNAVPRIIEFDVAGNVVANTVGDVTTLSGLSWSRVSATRTMTSAANTAALSVSYEARTLSSPDVTFTFETDTLGWNAPNLVSATSNTSVARTGNASAYLNALNTFVNNNLGTGANGNVSAMAVQSNGKIVLGGDFTAFNGTTVNAIARLNSDGSLDTTFDNVASTGTKANGNVNAIAIQSDGKILVGGAFTTFNGVTVNRIARLNADGSGEAVLLDSDFDTNTGTGANNTVSAIATQSDGKIVIGGDFTTFNGTTVNAIARLSSAGFLDTAFTTNTGTGANGNVSAMAVQSDDKIVIGGHFTTFNGTTVNRIARLSSAGVLDTTFDTNTGTGANAVVSAIALQSDGKIVLGGDFTTFNGTTVNRIVRLNSEGTEDTAFTANIGTGADSGVEAIAIQPDGKILLGGAFTTFNGTTVNRIVRLNSDGTLDTAFTTALGTGASGTSVRTIVVRQDTTIVFGGSFTTVNAVSASRIFGIVYPSSSIFYAYFPAVLPNVTYGLSGFARVPTANANVNVFAKIVEFSDSGASIETANTIGTTVTVTGPEDTAFTTNIGTGSSNTINNIAVQSDGKILVGGNFATFNGTTVNRIVRLNSDGTRDTAFTTNTGTGSSNYINNVATQSDGKILLGGFFTTFNGTTVNSIVRLNSDGTSDTAFTTNTGTGAGTGGAATVNAIAIQSDDKILLGGGFTTFNGTTVNRIVRLNSDGTRDTTFTTNTGTAANNLVYAIAIQSDGKIVIGGDFTTFNGTTVNRIARLNTDGTLDTTFDTNTGTGADSTVNAIALQSDGKILLGGQFTTFNGTTVNDIARLNSDGTLDTTFTNNTGTGTNGSLYAVAIQSDGKIVIGGSFSGFDGTAVNRIARLNADGTLDTAFTSDVTGTGPNGTIYSLAIQSDNKILLGGTFETFNGTTVNDIIRLNPENVAWNIFHVDHTFSTSVQNAYFGVVVSGSVYIDDIQIKLGGYSSKYYLDEGSFKTALTSSVDSVNINVGDTVILKETTGAEEMAGNYAVQSVTTTTGTGLDLSIFDASIQSDGKIVVGGQFTVFNGVAVNRIARLNSDGAFDITFLRNIGTGADNTIEAVAVRADGKILLGGDFNTFNGTTVEGIVRLNANGTVDTAFTANTGDGSNNTVRAIALQSDGKIIIGGDFTTFNGTTVNRIVRLNSEGTEDTAFTANIGTGASGSVTAIATQSDGKILLGGFFTTFNGTTVNRIVRLNSDGTLDTAFTTNTGTGADSGAYVLALQSDGKIILGGLFTTFNGTTVNRIVRLNSDGTLDTTFSTNTGTGFDAHPLSIAVQSDGKILLSGNFANFNGVQANRIVRLNSDGTRDAGFFVTNTETGGSTNGFAYAIALQSDGKILLGGGMFIVNEVIVNGIALLNSDGTVDTSFYPTTGGSQFVFTFNGSTSESLENFYNSEDVFVVQGADTSTVNEQNFSPFGKLSEDRYNHVSLGDRQIWGANGYTHSIVSAELRQNVATLISLSDHYASPGDSLEVFNLDVALNLQSSSGIFDGTHVVRSVIDPKTLTYISDNSDVALTEITTGGAYYIRKNNEIPKNYAVYIEADENTSPVLYSNFDVFEVLGEASTRNAEARITNFSLQNNVATLVLESFPSIVTQDVISSGFLLSATVSIDADSLSGGNANTFNGSFTVQSASIASKTITYNVVNANIASEAVTGGVLLEVGATHSELNPTGFSLYDEAGKIVARLSSLEYNALNIGATQITAEGDAGFGDTSINGTLLAEEEATFESLSTFNSDLAIYSTSENSTANLYGSFDRAGYHTVFDVVDNIVAVTNTVVAYSNANVRSIDILNRFARGLVYSVRLAEATEANYTMSTLYAAMGVGTFKLEADRNFLFVVSTGSTQIITDTNVSVRMEFVLTNTAPSFTLNTTATPSFAKKVHLRETGYNGTWPDMVFQYTSVDRAVSPINDGGANVASDFRIAANENIFWMVRWATDTTTRDNLDFDRISPDKTAMFNIYDMGPATGAMVGNIDADSDDWQTTGTAVLAGSGNTIVSRTVTVNTSGSRTREGTGATNVGVDVEQAHPTNTSTPRKGQALFPTFSSVATLSEDLTKPGFTISKLEVFLEALVATKGSVLYVGISASTNLGTGANTVPTPIPGSPVLNSLEGLGTGIKTLSTGTSYYDITPFAPYFQNGTARSLLVGLTDSTTNVYTNSLSNYAKFRGSSGASSNISLRVTYSFNLG